MNSYNNEISIRELIFKVRDLLKYLRSRWIILMIAGILGGMIGFTYALQKKVQYKADLTFVLEESKMSSLGSYSGLASQFGIDLGENSSSGVFSGDNILEFLKSKLIVENALLFDTMISGKGQTLADLYIDVYEIKKNWTYNSDLSNVSFASALKLENLSRLQDSVMRILYDDILKNNLTVEKPDKKLGFINISTISANEDFSQYFTEKLVSGAIDFYIRTRTQRARSNVDNLQKQADSLVDLLDRKTYDVAVNQDLNLNPTKKVAMIGTEIFNRDKTLLATMYSEVERNLGMAKMTLVQETPIIQVVDRPVQPLQRIKVGKVIATVAMSFLFLFICSFYLWIKRLFRLQS